MSFTVEKGEEREIKNHLELLARKKGVKGDVRCDATEKVRRRRRRRRWRQGANRLVETFRGSIPGRLLPGTKIRWFQTSWQLVYRLDAAYGLL
jgi:hypothetical protein